MKKTSRRRCVLALVAAGWGAGGLGALPVKRHVTHEKGSASLHHAVAHAGVGHASLAHKAVGRAGGRRSVALHKVSVRGVPTHHAVISHATVESRRLTGAFIASATLRPMAQQLIASRSVAAYDGVLAYATAHPGEPAAAANLAVAHAYTLDHRYGDAETAFRSAATGESSLADYADFLGAQAAIAANRPGDAVISLQHFAERYPGSLFVPQAPVLLATAYLAQNDSGNALRVLQPLTAGNISSHLDFRVTLARAYQMAGNTAAAGSLYRDIYVKDPLNPEAANARMQLAALNVPLTAGERKQHADALFNAHQYSQASAEYHGLSGDPSLSDADRNALQIYQAVCDLKLKRLSRGDIERLPVTNDDTAALKLYLQAELARNEGNSAEQDTTVQMLLERYPSSRWLEEALYSGGNMYLIRRDLAHAAQDYTTLVQHFPHSVYAPGAHWHAAWLNYRLHHLSEAAKLFDEQITSYPGGVEIPGALYWRGRLYEDVENNPAQALNYYKALNAAYVNSYYAVLARGRMATLGSRVTAVDLAPALASVRELEDPHLIDDVPENDPHLLKAKLLANAALNEYIRPEIQLSPTAGQWGALAEAQIYQSFGENSRALQAMKRSKVPFFSLPVSEVPTAYWQLVFPRPYWPQLSGDAQSQGLDPYLVASLIRQESEFNPGVVSHANAYGLMQLLPSTGKMLAKQQGERHFSTGELFDPTENLRLGTAYLRQNIDHYGGQVEYALAAYNAGDGPVRQWIASGDYKDIPEWVESIPYTETRDYVQSILRNREVYKAVYSGR